MSMLQLHVVFRNPHEFLNVEMLVQSMLDTDSANPNNLQQEKTASLQVLAVRFLSRGNSVLRRTRH